LGKLLNNIPKYHQKNFGNKTVNSYPKYSKKIKNKNNFTILNRKLKQKIKSRKLISKITKIQFK